MTIAAGIDVGTSAVKVAIFQTGPGTETRLAGRVDRLLRRNPLAVAEESFLAALGSAGLDKEQVDYIATTGEGDLVEWRRGHFYTMTTHARGAKYLVPEATAALDVGALHARAIHMDERAKVLQYRMTSQCASGSGQFLENIARYLGVTLEDVGTLSLDSQQSEKISSICAVLAETDVINFVSRGIAPGNILRGIHESMAGRYVRLLKAANAAGTVAITGGLSKDVGLVGALNRAAEEQKMTLTTVAHPEAIMAGAYGAALWGAFRHDALQEKRSA
ncbi:MAG: benzoyl-CoA reductase subunit D [Candidatus Lambdaproteobacteria bacterium]|nr:benzoyl-CoA reductase subunit D [Candidatus Lambdaproteobacteria bacterium]